MQETTLEFLEGQLSSRDSPQVSAQPGLVWESWGRGIDVGEEAPAEARGRVKVGTGQPVWPEFPSTRPTATKGVPMEPGHSPLSPQRSCSHCHCPSLLAPWKGHRGDMKTLRAH